MNEKVIKDYWSRFLQQTGRHPDSHYSFCGYMGPTEAIANDLLSLILSATKTATTSCLLSYQAENDPIPTVGSLGIVTDWQGTPKCVIENTAVTILPFKDVTFDICKREGEDSNLESWQATHFSIFTKEGNELGFQFTLDTPIVFEDFKVVYP